MRSVSGDGDTVLPWHVIREDGHGNRYRVASYSTRAEAELVADRLCGSGSRAKSDQGDACDEGDERDGRDQGGASYLVEPLGCASGEPA
jgi:hypothetical protein